MKEDRRCQNASNKTAASSLAALYDSHGFVGPIEILSRDEANHALQAFHEWTESLTDQQVKGDLRFKMHLFLPFVNRIVRHPKLVEAVQQVLQTKHVLLWSCDFNVKEPNTEMRFSPHQDATYAGLSPADQCVTAWVALSHPVGEEQGCLRFKKESHKQGQLPHVKQPSDVHNMLSRRQHVADPFKEKEWVAVPLRGGEATLHQFFTIHQSGPNRSTQPRVGLAIRYMAASVIQTGKVRETVTLISGSLQHDGFDLEPDLPLDNPTEAEIRIGKEAHAEAMRREAANYFDGADTSAYDESINKD